MHQDIENIIINNLPEKKGEVSWLNEDATGGYNIALDEINTSLIADEVLKVVVEKLEKVFDKHCNYSPKKIESEEEYGYNKGLMAEAKLLKFEILQLLSEHLSPNKENEK